MLPVLYSIDCKQEISVWSMRKGNNVEVSESRFLWALSNQSIQRTIKLPQIMASCDRISQKQERTLPCLRITHRFLDPPTAVLGIASCQVPPPWSASGETMPLFRFVANLTQRFAKLPLPWRPQSMISPAMASTMGGQLQAKSSPHNFNNGQPILPSRRHARGRAVDPATGTSGPSTYVWISSGEVTVRILPSP
jgi:hypothetical protein